jgi:hypothetical protein
MGSFGSKIHASGEQDMHARALLIDLRDFTENELVLPVFGTVASHQKTDTNHSTTYLLHRKARRK